MLQYLMSNKIKSHSYSFAHENSTFMLNRLIKQRSFVHIQSPPDRLLGFPVTQPLWLLQVGVPFKLLYSYCMHCSSCHSSCRVLAKVLQHAVPTAVLLHQTVYNLKHSFRNLDVLCALRYCLLTNNLCRTR